MENELPETYRGMEVASHTETHRAPIGTLREAVRDSMDRLETLSGMPVTGMAYPGGEFTGDHLLELEGLGVDYARTTQYTHAFALPPRLLAWAPTCRYCDREMDCLLDAFLQPAQQPQLFYIMGHSYELEQSDPHADWAYMESICRRLAGREDIWYATNGEIAAHLLSTRQAVRR